MGLRLMVLLLVAAVVGLFFIDGPDGSPILSLDDFKPTMPQVETPIIVPSGLTKVYKRQDENGVWQFSNQPMEGDDVEVIEIDGNINIIQAVDIPARSTKKVAVKKITNKFASLPSGLTSVSPEKIGEMMDTVNSLQDTMDQRQEDLDKITGTKL